MTTSRSFVSSLLLLFVAFSAFGFAGCKVGAEAAKEWDEEGLNNRKSGGGRSCAARFAGPERSGDEFTLSDPAIQVAQAFTAESVFSARTVRLKLKAATSTSGKLIVKVEGDSNGAPDGVVLLTATLDSSSVTPAGDYYTFQFPVARELPAGRYWLLLKQVFSSVVLGGSGISWMATDADGYPGNGALVSTNDSSWSLTGLGAGTDFLFDFGC